MTQARVGRWLRVGAASLACLLLATLPATAAAPQAAKACPPASVGGKAVGKIVVGPVTVAIKRVHQGADGSFDSVPTNKVASVVAEWQPLTAKSGTTVLLWHSRFGVGCDGALNVLFDKKIGDTFVVIDGNGVRRSYEIAAINTVAKGKYWDSWFQWDGARQLTLVTCTGLINGKFTQNFVITALPV